MATFAISAVTRKAQATANGSTTEFSFSFSVNTEADVAVFVGTTLKTISTHYTVSITSSTGAGSITFTSGNTPTNGQIVTIMSKTALARSSVYTSGGTINATSLETDFDTNMMLFQQQDERLDRVITAPVDDATSIDMTLPNKDARKGKVLGFDETSGNPTAIEQLTGAAVNVSTVSVGGSATASVAVSGGTATFALGLPTGATGATGPAGGGLANVVEDTSPQLGANLDTNSHNILIDDAHFIGDESGNEQIVFQTTGSAVNHLEITNNASGSNPILGAAGDDTNIGIALTPKGTGEIVIAAGNLNYGGTAVTSTGAELNKLAGAGTLKQAGLETIWVPAAAMYPSTTNPCSDLTQVETTALRPDMKVLDFAADADDFAQFSIAFPKSWNEGTITFQVFWTPSTTNTGDCIWGLQGVSVADGATIDVEFGTAVTVTDAAIGTVEDQQVSPASGAVTITNAAVDTQTYFQIFRDANAVGDTFTGVSRLLGVKLFFTTDAANDA